MDTPTVVAVVSATGAAAGGIGALAAFLHPVGRARREQAQRQRDMQDIVLGAPGRLGVPPEPGLVERITAQLAAQNQVLAGIPTLTAEIPTIRDGLAKVRAAQVEAQERAAEEQATRNAEARLLRHELRGVQTSVVLLAADTSRVRREWARLLADQGHPGLPAGGPYLTTADPDVADVTDD